MRSSRMLLLTLVFAIWGATPSSAQQVPPAEAGPTLTFQALTTVLAGHESAVDQQRGQLTDFLSRDDVREVADERGIDMDQVESTAAGLSDGAVETIAPMIDAILQDGGGLGSITIGVGALILIVLILILLS